MKCDFVSAKCYFTQLLLKEEGKLSAKTLTKLKAGEIKREKTVVKFKGVKEPTI